MNIVALMQVAQHGSGLMNAWLLPKGAAMVEMHGSPPWLSWPAVRDLKFDRCVEHKPR